MSNLIWRDCNVTRSEHELTWKEILAEITLDDMHRVKESWVFLAFHRRLYAVRSSSACVMRRKARRLAAMFRGTDIRQ